MPPFPFSILYPPSSLLLSAFRQVISRQDEAFDSFTARDSFDDFGHVRERDVAIEEMIGLDQDADPARALIQTA